MLNHKIKKIIAVCGFTVFILDQDQCTIWHQSAYECKLLGCRIETTWKASHKYCYCRMSGFVLKTEFEYLQLGSWCFLIRNKARDRDSALRRSCLRVALKRKLLPSQLKCSFTSNAHILCRFLFYLFSREKIFFARIDFLIAILQFRVPFPQLMQLFCVRLNNFLRTY